MKTNLKSRIISILVVLAMLIASVPCAFAEETDVTEMAPLSEKYVEAYSLLKSLGVYTQDEIAALDSGAEISRAEFTKRLVKAMNLEDAANAVSGNTIFMDIHDKSYAGYINLAYDMGIVNGTGDASFEPNSPTTVQMAVSMVMRALGYNYLTSYTDIQSNASRLGVLNKIESKGSISVCDAALIIYNAVHKEPLSITHFSDEKQRYTPDGTWLEVWFNISYVDGILDATQITALKRKPAVGENVISVNGVKISEVPKGTDKLLGYPVRCYYVKDDVYNTFKHITSYGFNYNEIELKASEVEAFTTTLMKYYDENNKLKQYPILSSADFVYNGKAESLGVHPLSEMKTGYTSVKFLDNNNDEEFDVVFITKSTTVAVATVDAQRMSIVGKKSEFVKMQDDSTKVLNISNADGQTVLVNDIKEWNIVSVIKSFDEEYVEVIVSNASVTGVGESYYTSGKTYLTIDGTAYEIIPSLITSKEVQVGKAGTFYLSADGVICAVNYGSTSGGKWVWAVGIEREGGAFPNDYTFGCVEGDKPKFTTYQIADKVAVDGSPYDEKDLATVLPLTAFPEAMVINLNEDGEIIKINTLTQGVNESAEQNIYKRHKGPESDSILNDGKLHYNSYNSSMDGRYMLASNSLNYGFPTYDITAYNDMFKMTYIKDNQPKYSCTLYSEGIETPVISLSIALNENSTGEVGKDSGFVPFVRMGQQYDAETGDIIDVLYYLNAANAEQGIVVTPEIKLLEMIYSNKSYDFDGDGNTDYTAGTQKPIGWIIDRLEKGDIIYVGIDTKGLSGIQHVYDISQRKLVNSLESYYVDGAIPYYPSTRTFAGKLYEIKDDYLRIITDNANYNATTGIGMEIYKVSTVLQGWNRLLTISQNGDVSLSSVTTPAFPGVKQNCDDFEVIMAWRYGEPLYKMFIDYTNSPY